MAISRIPGTDKPKPYDPPYQFVPITAKPNTGLCLPYGHVDSSLRALAGQAEGFGRFAVGGLHGAVYRVITLAGWNFVGEGFIEHIILMLITF